MLVPVDSTRCCHPAHGLCSVLLIDDSIVRGTTMSQIVDMVRNAGAKKVSTFTSAPEEHSCLWECSVGQTVKLLHNAGAKTVSSAVSTGAVDLAAATSAGRRQLRVLNLPIWLRQAAC